MCLYAYLLMRVYMLTCVYFHSALWFASAVLRIHGNVLMRVELYVCARSCLIVCRWRVFSFSSSVMRVRFADSLRGAAGRYAGVLNRRRGDRAGQEGPREGGAAARGCRRTDGGSSVFFFIASPAAADIRSRSPPSVPGRTPRPQVRNLNEHCRDFSNNRRDRVRRRPRL